MAKYPFSRRQLSTWDPATSNPSTTAWAAPEADEQRQAGDDETEVRAGRPTATRDREDHRHASVSPAGLPSEGRPPDWKAGKKTAIDGDAAPGGPHQFGVSKRERC